MPEPVIIAFAVIGVGCIAHGLTRKSCGTAIIGVSFLFSAALGLVIQ